MKYIIYKVEGEEREDVEIFNGKLRHRDVAEFLMRYFLSPKGIELVSAGFFFLFDGKVSVSGDSMTLNLSSRPEDAEIITKRLGGV